jgi:hypothetical protein
MAHSSTPWHGKIARVEYDDTVIAESVSWSIDASAAMADTSTQGKDWTTALMGLKSATGTMEFKQALGNAGQIAMVNAFLNGTLITNLKFLLDTSANAFIGNVWITGMGTSTGIGDSVPISFPFQFDDAMSLTDAA